MCCPCVYLPISCDEKKSVFSLMQVARSDPQLSPAPDSVIQQKLGPTTPLGICPVFTTALTIRAMPVSTSMAAASIAPEVLALSKRAWKLGAALSKLNQYVEVANTTATALTETVKSLGNECDLVYAELESAISGGEAGWPPLHHDDATTWHCLDMHAKETGRTLQDLEAIVRERPQTLAQRNENAEGIRISLCRHTDNLRTILLLISV
jgi:hypothetical protein